MATSDPKRTAVARTQRGARYGSGTLVKRAGPHGDTWIAKWRDGGRQVQRGLGFVHSKKHPEGLTRAEAEGALGKLREQVAIDRAQQRAAEARRAAEERRRTLTHVGEAIIAAKRAAGRKPSTIEAYSYWLRIHILDFFGPAALSETATTSAPSRPLWSARGWRPSHAPAHSGLCTRCSSSPSTRGG